MKHSPVSIVPALSLFISPFIHLHYYKMVSTMGIASVLLLVAGIVVALVSVNKEQHDAVSLLFSFFNAAVAIYYYAKAHVNSPVSEYITPRRDTHYGRFGEFTTRTVALVCGHGRTSLLRID